ncbi:MAG: HlyC/CorC family transporter, partial [Clostridia bacterium]|nr:HlyC/CorC family transporter [Clostridia bacterium]
TMEDVLEQLVGEIWDENDEIEQEFICIDDTHFEADGDMRIYDFFDEFDIDIDEDDDFENDNSTVGGWTTTMLEGNTAEGESFQFENLLITVKEAEEHRVERILVEKLPTVGETEE